MKLIEGIWRQIRVPTFITINSVLKQLISACNLKINFHNLVVNLKTVILIDLIFK